MKIKCTRCGSLSNGIICTECGFDISCDIINLKTLAVPGELDGLKFEVSSLRAENAGLSKKIDFIMQFLDVEKKIDEQTKTMLDIQKSMIDDLRKDVTELKQKAVEPQMSKTVEPESNPTAAQSPVKETVRNADVTALPQVGSSIIFGRYPIHSANTVEPIEWEVLDVNNEKKTALVISKYCLDAYPYDSGSNYSPWSKSGIRKYLNNYFINIAFSAKEQARILTTPIHTYSINDVSHDKVWLFSNEDVKFYYRTAFDRRAVPTAYAASRGALQAPAGYGQYLINNERCCMWRLYSPTADNRKTQIVSFNGKIDSGEVNDVSYAIRPAMRIDFSGNA